MRFVLMIALLLRGPLQTSSVFEPEFRRVDPTSRIFRTIHQSRFADELTLSVVLGDPPRNYEVPPESRYWNRDGLLGIFLRDQSGQISTVTVMRNPMGECNVAVEHADINSVVLSRTTEDYGVLLPALKILSIQQRGE